MDDADFRRLVSAIYASPGDSEASQGTAGRLLATWEQIIRILWRWITEERRLRTSLLCRMPGGSTWNTTVPST